MTRADRWVTLGGGGLVLVLTGGAWALQVPGGTIVGVLAVCAVVWEVATWAQRRKSRAIRQNETDSAEIILSLTLVEGGRLVVKSRRQVFETPSMWGLALTDAARFIARSYDDPNEALGAIRTSMEAELDSPTDEVKDFQ